MNCHQCNKSIRTDDKNAGKKGRCPGCGTTIEIASPGQVATADWLDASDDVYDAEEVPAEMPLSSQRGREGKANLGADGRAMKQCRMCGEDILAIAVRCRYCKSPLAGIPDRPGEDQFLVWREGSLLVMDKDSQLPDRCVKSNQPADGFTLKRELAWHPQYLYLFLLASPIIYIIIAVCTQKKAKISIGLTREWGARRRWRILIAWIAAIGGIVVMVIGIAGANGNSPVVWLVPAGIIGCLGAIVYGIVGTRLVVPTRITDTHVWLKGVHPDYLATLAEWPGE